MPELDWMWEASEVGIFCREHEIRNRLNPADFSTFEKGMNSFHVGHYNDKSIYELLPLEICEQLGIKAVEFNDKYIKINKCKVDSVIESIYPDLLQRTLNSRRYAVEIAWRFNEIYNPYFDGELNEPIFLSPGDIIYEGSQSKKGYFGGKAYTIYKYLPNGKFECLYYWGLVIKYIGMEYDNLENPKIIPPERIPLIKQWEHTYNGRQIDLSIFRKI